MGGYCTTSRPSDRDRKPAWRRRDPGADAHGGDGEADGDTISQIPFSLLRAGASERMKFDPATDLAYIIGLTGYTFGVVVRNDAPWATFEELLADAKKRPGKITFGSPGSGTTPHVTMERIAVSGRSTGCIFLSRAAPRPRTRFSAAMSMPSLTAHHGGRWWTPARSACW